MCSGLGALAQVSPSGTGLRLFLRGKLPERGRRRAWIAVRVAGLPSNQRKTRAGTSRASSCAARYVERDARIDCPAV